MGNTNNIKQKSFNNHKTHFDNDNVSQCLTYLDPKAFKTIKFKYDNYSIEYSINNNDTRYQIRRKLLKLFNELEEILQKAIQKTDDPEYIQTNHILTIKLNFKYVTGETTHTHSLKSSINHINILQLLCQYQQFPVNSPLCQLNYMLATSIYEIGKLDKYHPWLKLKLTYDNLIDLLNKTKLISPTYVVQVKIKQDDDIIITLENLNIDKLLERLAPNLNIIDTNGINNLYTSNNNNLPPYQEKDPMYLS